MFSASCASPSPICCCKCFVIIQVSLGCFLLVFTEDSLSTSCSYSNFQVSCRAYISHRWAYCFQLHLPVSQDCCNVLVIIHGHESASGLFCRGGGGGGGCGIVQWMDHPLPPPRWIEIPAYLRPCYHPKVDLYKPPSWKLLLKLKQEMFSPFFVQSERTENKNSPLSPTYWRNPCPLQHDFLLPGLRGVIQKNWEKHWRNLFLKMVYRCQTVNTICMNVLNPLTLCSAFTDPADC